MYQIQGAMWSKRMRIMNRQTSPDASVPEDEDEEVEVEVEEVEYEEDCTQDCDYE
jgi:hypothetical protein